jgi:hypothetical protein
VDDPRERAGRSDGKMPVARYFLFVGGVLLALLFVANLGLPELPAPQAAHDASADLPPIRIHSDRKWPERVVFDTSVPATRPLIATAQARVPAPAAVAEISVNQRVREAFAQLKPSEPELKQDVELKQPDPVKPQPLPPQKRKIAKKRVAPPMVLVAQQPQFGLFTRNTW